jgi:hypothetical protein
MLGHFKMLGQTSTMIFFTSKKKKVATVHVQMCPDMSVAVFAELQKANICFVFPSVCLSAWNISARPGRIFMKFDF